MRPDRRQLLVAGISVPMVMATRSLAEDESTEVSTEEMVAVYRLCGCSPGSREVLQPILARFAETFQCTILQGVDSNPRCCFWLELIGQANPGDPGWFVVHHGGGSICYATDATQMGLAVDRLAEIAVTADGFKLLPAGITTSYPSRTV
jgi:hypothetical protein